LFTKIKEEEENFNSVFRLMKTKQFPFSLTLSLTTVVSTESKQHSFYDDVRALLASSSRLSVESIS
jgi:hypothetical protein